MQTQLAVERLSSQLPLKYRQQQLPAALKVVHLQILYTLIKEGRVPEKKDLQEILGDESIMDALQYLGQNDLVVLDKNGYVIGAYPVTLESTPHNIEINGHHIYAMCALDAVSVAPMFNMEVTIRSVCHLSQTPIYIKMHTDKISAVQPETDVTVGVRWQMPTNVAAHSMCTEMVFFKDRDTAEAWQKDDVTTITLFTLHEALAFGKAFFLPLLD